jgi:diguanylate cyclase (GGDEF)-like protein
MEWEKAGNLKTVRSLTLLMGFTFALFTFSDYYFHGIEGGFYVSIALRVAALLITIVAFLFVGKLTRYERSLLMITMTELTIFAIYLVNLYNQKSNEPALQFMTVMLFIWAVFLIPNKLKNCIVNGCISLVTYIIVCFFFLESSQPPPLTQRAIYLSIGLALCAIFIFGRETSQRRQFATEQLLEFLSITDRLTGIYNRGRFEYVLNLWIKNKRHDPFSLLLFDIDNFKKVNDRFGHSVGDQVLIETTGIITAHIRDVDIFARWGGEEFVILFDNTTLECAIELGERLRKSVEANSCGEAGRVTISVGVAAYRREEPILDFVNRADEKMYEAKQAGKNQVVAES